MWSGTRVRSWANNGNALVRNASDDDVGQSEYRKLVDEVSRRFQSQADLKTFLETIQRPEARDLIYDFFLEQAAGEALRGRESELVDWLAVVWQLEVKIDDGEAR